MITNLNLSIVLITSPSPVVKVTSSRKIANDEALMILHTLANHVLGNNSIRSISISYDRYRTLSNKQSDKK